MKLIECKNVSFSYEGKTALNNVNFVVNTGDYICIIGNNGSGKSTLVKGILKLKEPDEGKISYYDIKSTEIGYLPQQANIQDDFPASVFEVVLSGKLNSLGGKLFFRKNEKKDAVEKMKLLGIKEIKNKSYQELSGGQKQRVLLARALCATKKIILLDEPVSGLDPVITADLYKMVADLNKNYGITVIMVSHDIDSALKYSTHILHLEHTQLYFGETNNYIKKADIYGGGN